MLKLDQSEDTVLKLEILKFLAVILTLTTLGSTILEAIRTNQAHAEESILAYPEAKQPFYQAKPIRIGELDIRSEWDKAFAPR